MNGKTGQDHTGQGLWTGDTLPGLLRDLAERRPDAPAIIAGETTIGFAELEDRARRVAAGLSGLGIGKGDTVSIQLPNLPEFIISLLATASLGAVLSTIHMPYGPAEAADLIRHVDSRAVICLGRMGDRSPAEAMLGLKDGLPSLEHVIAVGEPVAGTVPFADLLMADPSGAPAEFPSAEYPFLALFTSGTSANPKCVLTDSRRYLSNARLNFAETGMGEDSIMMSAPPFSHLLGLYTVQLALYAGCPSLLLPVFSPPAFVDTIAAGRPTHIFTAPAHVAACRQMGLLDRDRLSSVEFAIVSGAMAGTEIYTDFQDYLTNGEVGQLWGMTEAQCGLFTRPGDGVERSSVFCGRAATGNELRVVGPDGGALPPGEEGALQIRGCSVFDGYYRNDAATAVAFTDDGWFRTGDLALMDADGYVAITGRDKDIVNRGGIKINPSDVEAAIDRHPDVLLSAIVPMPDPVLGEKACCFVQLRPGAALALDDVTGWLEGQGVAKLKWPERLEIIDDMPLTPTRKIIKGRLRIPQSN